MNKVELMGRLTKDPEVRYSQSEKATAIARYTLAVDRRYRREGEGSADFIPCVAFGRQGEFAEKYLQKGMRIIVIGHIQTGSYENQEGRRIYTTDVVVEEQEFAESQKTGAIAEAAPEEVSDAPSSAPDPDGEKTSGLLLQGFEDELPFM